MRLWVRRLLLLPFLPAIYFIMFFALSLVIEGDKCSKAINRFTERKQPECKTVKVGHYVVCKNPNCDFKEFA